jgi:5-oxoprolinase (ATP-hydrolysing) subunit A
VERRVDLNSDLGESFGRWSLGDDEAMFDVISSANIACGFHAGDPVTMLTSCRLAAERGVAVGAHVSYRDLAGFGRRVIEIEPRDLYGDVVYQLAALRGIAESVGTRVSYVKPHGALYNRIVTDPVQAEAVASAVASVDSSLPILGLAGSQIELACRDEQLSFVREAFVDRSYRADGTLVPRGDPQAVLVDAAAVAKRAVDMITTGSVLSVDGSPVQVDVDSLCVHGDTPGAVVMARAVRRALEAAGVTVSPFSRGAAVGTRANMDAGPVVDAGR